MSSRSASLLALAAQVAADRVAHAEVVKLLHSGVALDFVIDLLDRPAANSQSVESTAEQGPPAPAAPREPAYWIATITGNEVAAPEQLLASVIAERRVLAICPWGKLRGEGSPGDWVGFFVPGKGLVGHAQLASIVDDSTKVVRHARRFSCVYRLERVTLYERPILQALRADRPFAVPPADVPLDRAVPRADCAAGFSCADDLQGRSGELRGAEIGDRVAWPSARHRGADPRQHTGLHDHFLGLLAQLRVAEGDFMLADRQRQIPERRIADQVFR